jgi:hypothetical protein
VAARSVYRAIPRDAPAPTASSYLVVFHRLSADPEA